MKQIRIAYFISPHGFGHASRACSIMIELTKIYPEIRFEIFTKVPKWFFQDSLVANFGYHPFLTDVGLVQESPLKENLDETIKALSGFFPFRKSIIKNLSEKVKKLKCKIIICDISPLGIAVAHESGICSILIENFTWDWIYREYAKYNSGFLPYVEYLKNQFKLADYHIQTEPVCGKRKSDLTVPPISRGKRKNSTEVRKILGIKQNSKVVMITMGGIREKNNFLKSLQKLSGIIFIIPGGSLKKTKQDNLILLPFHSEFFHPDLINASDAVVGKAGYSTLAEVYASGVPFGYITRSMFRESKVLMQYIKKNMQGIAINENQYIKGRWIKKIPLLLSLPKKPGRENGAGPSAEFIYKITCKNVG